MERQRNPAIKWGLIFGGLLIVVGLANTGIEYATGTFGRTSVTSGNLGASLGQTCIVFLIEVALYFGAGLLAARDNGRVGTGAVAGLIAGALAGVVGLIVSIPLVMSMKFPVPAGTTIDPAQYQSIVTIGVIVGSILGLGVAIGIGAGIGALGGLVGRGQFERAHPVQPVMESFYSPMAPAPGYPQLPQQPGYPQAQQPGYPPMPQPGYPPMPPVNYSPPNPGQYPPPDPQQNPPAYPPQDPPPYPQQ